MTYTNNRLFGVTVCLIKINLNLTVYHNQLTILSYLTHIQN